MIRHFFIAMLLAEAVQFLTNPAWTCGERIEVAFFETDGDIFEITNKSRGPMTLAQLTIRLTGSRGRLIFDTEFGGPGASMARPSSP